MITNARFSHYGRVRMFNEMQRNMVPQPPTEAEAKSEHAAKKNTYVKIIEIKID